jgi:tetratricopeptide (TPR) repeat protein/tRNA A-37 threonylcarbamoyl transferase component Bud32
MVGEGDKLTVPEGNSHRESSEHSERIGPYRILQVLGEGGMGVVYEAEQTAPVRRRVALKVMKVGMDTREVVARFEAERQALAVMSHPGIAKVLDAGASETGRPYFAMELVKGVPITEYCDTRKLGTRERLELFRSVCQAVQHAHQKGVIHRDLKPSNVLISEADGRPAAKIIDFGIAKAIGQHLTDKTLVTSYGQAMGTPAYMSPEQAEMSGLDVDTRADIYSLGVMLYELLVGELPLDPQEVGLPGFIAQLVLRETDPPTPSAKFAGLGERREYLAENRGTDQQALRRQLRGDLDWIVMKAMDKDRNRRYETANGMALDVQRYLDHEPVVARHPSAGYRLRKFVRRHRAGVALGSVIALLLIVSAVGMGIQAARIARERDRAELEAAKAAAVNEFLQRMLGSADPRIEGRDVKVADVLDQATGEVEESFGDQPEVGAAVRFTLGRTYRGLGLYPEAETQLRKALELRRATLPPGHPEIAASLGELGIILQYMGSYAEAEALFREALAIRVGTVGTEHVDVAESLNNLAQVLIYQGDYAQADSLLREALDMRRRLLGDQHLDVAGTLGDLGVLQFRLGNYAAAEPLFREALETQTSLQGEHVDVAALMNNLAMTLGRLERHQEAEQLYRDALALNRKLLGDEHPEVARSLNNLGAYLRRIGKPDDAEPLVREALAMNRRLLGDVNPEVAANLSQLGLILRDQRKYDESEAILREALAMDRRLLGSDHPDVAGDLNDLGSVLTANGKYRQAEQVFREARQIQVSVFGEESWQVAATESLLANCLVRAGRYREAEPLAVRAFEIIRAEFGDGHSRTRTALDRVIAVYEGLGEAAKAAEYRSKIAP